LFDASKLSRDLPYRNGLIHRVLLLFHELARTKVETYGPDLTVKTKYEGNIETTGLYLCQIQYVFMNITFKIADTDLEFEQAKELFQEYAEFLNVDLCFQNFSGELENLRKQYDKPDGLLLLAYLDELPAGCVGVRQFDSETAELKRMFVRPEYRGYKLGKELLERAMEGAKALGYEKMKLDTLANLVKARELYESFGFQTIPAYRFNPIDGAIYMEKTL
jgi:putative acetyltransferase